MNDKKVVDKNSPEYEKKYQEALYKYCRENKIEFTYDEKQKLWDDYNKKGEK